jgi:hypothetical protein
LDLSNNQRLDTIDPEAFRNLPSVINLQIRTANFATFDFAIFNGMLQLEIIEMFNQLRLETVTISDLNKIPSNIQKVDLGTAKLKTVDPKFQTVVARPNFQLLDISENYAFQCDENAQWIAQFALFTTVRVKIHGCKCGNIQGKTLEQYLRDTVPNACQ